MHATESISLPDYDRGLALIRWKARGFDEMRRLGLLSHKVEFELVEGMILEREFRTPRHDRVVAEIAGRVKDAVTSARQKICVNKELRLDDFDSVVCPDIMLPGRDQPPRLIVEVSETAPRLDAQEKERLYARAGVEEYWHVDLAWNVWETHCSPHADGYGMRASGPSYRPALIQLEGMGEITLDELLAAAHAAA